jgi:glucan phosphoethanolaminetransferase (alkaline phosphatase superfamily)
MNTEYSQSGSKTKLLLPVRYVYGLLAPKAYSVIMFGALFCTMAVKFFHAWRMDLVNEYVGWILADVAVLLGAEVVFAVVCFILPRRWVIRVVCILAAVVCTWSVMSAGWLIRTGTQILPAVLLPLVRDPLNALGIIGVNLAKMPAAAIILLGPSAVALTFFFFVLARPVPPGYNRRLFVGRIVISVTLVIVAVLVRAGTPRRSSAQVVSEGLRYNCQLRAVTFFLLSGSARQTRADLADAGREIPDCDRLQLVRASGTHGPDQNIVIVVLEGIQYKYTSLYDKENNLTPYLASLAEQGVEFVNARSTLTHTTKVLFSLLTGRFPSVSQDLAEAVPVVKPYASIATILKQRLSFRTAFFQSAKGNFESRPGLVYNLGFEKFWARDDLGDPNAFLGYLACDEFSMLEPVVEWIKGGDGPFLLTILCSVSHDPYQVPEWFAEPAREPLERYEQAISYTDKFIAALDVELAKLNLTNETVLCVIGDHGEAFGEHGLLGHERIAFEEVLRIPFCLRAPFLVEPGRKIRKAVSSVDLTPTLLGLFGFAIPMGNFDGANVLASIPADRKVYFSGWLRESPAGFLRENRKFIYYPTAGTVSVYDLNADPFELMAGELEQEQAQTIADQIIGWRRDSIFRLDQRRTGKKEVFGNWLCRWNNRVASAKYQPKMGE